ncbi:UNVERIFIED_CONTAM: hypothetical protein Slati_0534300 [Sesamum latifolium]|uniref:Translation initiation factor eIF2B subunit gamma n=1 Tax=Sesamum latifolium TaxID=2727402 RepID=A0AAW2Y0Q7_9LAMI
MDFQVVVLAGGFSKTLVPLVSKEVPKALLPVANRPVLSYVLELLEQNDLKNAIVLNSYYCFRLVVAAIKMDKNARHSDAMKQEL